MFYATHTIYKRILILWLISYYYLVLYTQHQFSPCTFNFISYTFILYKFDQCPTVRFELFEEGIFVILYYTIHSKIVENLWQLSFQKGYGVGHVLYVAREWQLWCLWFWGSATVILFPRCRFFSEKKVVTFGSAWNFPEAAAPWS